MSNTPSERNRPRMSWNTKMYPSSPSSFAWAAPAALSLALYGVRVIRIGSAAAACAGATITVNRRTPSRIGIIVSVRTIESPAGCWARATGTDSAASVTVIGTRLLRMGPPREESTI